MTDSSDTRSDADLLAAARRGDRAAIEVLVARYQARVFRFGVRMCGNPDDAGDVAQETLLAMARSLERFRGDAELSTWLYTIARRFCVKARRRRVADPVREESLESLAPDERESLAAPVRDPERELQSRQMADALTAALAALPPAQREVLILRDMEGLTAPEVGKVLGLGVAAVKSRLHRARQAVQAELAPILGPVPGEAASGRCPDVVSLFSRYLEGELAPGTCARMEAHLARCGRCDAACQSLRRVLALCRDAQAPAVPPGLDQSVRRAIRDYLDHHRQASA
jgi:RNA polymerase sigma-70 factor (ECF subfamily)